MKESRAISIQVDSDLIEQSEEVMSIFGLDMTTTVNMLLKQIVRERAIPLSLSIDSESRLKEDLIFAQIERLNGYKGISGDEMADKMDAIIAEAVNEQ